MGSVSIEDSDKIDIIGTDRATGNIVLTISDHLDWADERRHLLLLQEKLNAYLRFLESGQVYESCPEARGHGVIVSVVAQHEMSEAGLSFLETAKKILEGAGFALQWRRLQL